MSSPEIPAVPVRLDEDETLLIGTSPATPAGAGLVRFAGAELVLDPTAPDDPPHLVVHDPAAAAPAMELLLGRAVADAAGRVAGGGGAEAVAVEPGGLLATARELAILHWLELHSPDLLPAGLLDIGIGTAAAALGSLLSDTDSAAAQRRLADRAGLLAGIAARLRANTGPAPAGLAPFVDRALAATVAVLPFDSPDHDELVHEEELARAGRVLGAGIVPDWDDLLLLPGVGAREPAAATRAGDDGQAQRRRTSVDWYQVPHGVLDSAEQTVTWTLTGGDVPRVDVAVRALPGVRPAGGLTFRLYAENLPLPIAVGSLRLPPGGAEYVGSAVLHAPPVGRLTLDVHDAAVAKRPRLGVDRVTAEGVRWTARAVTALRLGGPSGAADSEVRSAAQEAVRIYRRVRATHPREAARELAVRRQARCVTLLRAVLQRSDGGSDELARLNTIWERAAPPVLDADTRIPDLDGPGWTTLPVENALGAGPEWRLS